MIAIIIIIIIIIITTTTTTTTFTFQLEQGPHGLGVEEFGAVGTTGARAEFRSVEVRLHFSVLC
jgi:uncharacterized integral membrane protein